MTFIRQYRTSWRFNLFTYCSCSRASPYPADGQCETDGDCGKETAGRAALLPEAHAYFEGNCAASPKSWVARSRIEFEKRESASRFCIATIEQTWRAVRQSQCAAQRQAHAGAPSALRRHPRTYPRGAGADRVGQASGHTEACPAHRGTCGRVHRNSGIVWGYP